MRFVAGSLYRKSWPTKAVSEATFVYIRSLHSDESLSSKERSAAHVHCQWLAALDVATPSNCSRRWFRFA